MVLLHSKLCVIGDSRVGKTTLIKKFTQGEFQEDYISTIGAQFSIYDYKLNGDEIKLFFWDLAGQKDFKTFRSSFYRDSNAVIIVYSLEQNEMGYDSKKNIMNWYNEMREHCEEIPIVIFANKLDLLKEGINLEELRIEELNQKDLYLGEFQTSAKTGTGVTDAFKAIIEKLYFVHKEGL